MKNLVLILSLGLASVSLAHAAEPAKLTLSCDVISYINVPGEKAPKMVVEGTLTAEASSENDSLIARGSVGHGDKTLATVYVFAPYEFSSAGRTAWMNLEIDGQPKAYAGAFLTKKHAGFLSVPYLGAEKASSGDAIHELGLKCLLK